MSLLEIIKRHPYILLFGVFQLFFSAPGQTVIISLFVASIFNDLGISISLFAGIYSTATLVASLFLNPAGRLIDRYPVRTILIGITGAMALGCFMLASAHHIIFVFAAFLLLRLIGQGVFTLTASTVIAKTFEANRGKAMGLMSLGFPFSEMIYPSIAVSLLAVFGWRTSFLIFGISNLLIMLPLQIFLIKKSGIIKGELLPGEEVINPQRLRGDPEHRKIKTQRDFTLGEALQDIKFYLILAASCLAPAVVTGIFFHQNSILATNHWPVALTATGIGIYAASKAVSSVAIGPVVDKYGPLGPFVVLILLLGFGTLLLGFGGSTWIFFLSFGIIGVSLGFTAPVLNVIWPSFYGTKHLGSIKGLIATFRNGFTALGPLPIALALDAGISINTILNWTALGILILSSLPLIVQWLSSREGLYPFILK